MAPHAAVEADPRGTDGGPWGLHLVQTRVERGEAGDDGEFQVEELAAHVADAENRHVGQATADEKRTGQKRLKWKSAVK